MHLPQQAQEPARDLVSRRRLSATKEPVILSPMRRNMMNRRELLQAAAAVLPLIASAGAQQVAAKSNGLPPLTIKDCKVITTNGGGRYRWVFLKIITSEPGLYGIGSANNHYETMPVVTALEENLKPWLIGKDPDRIEDLWQVGADADLLAQRAGEQQCALRHGHGPMGHQGQAGRYAGLRDAGRKGAGTVSSL